MEIQVTIYLPTNNSIASRKLTNSTFPTYITEAANMHIYQDKIQENNSFVAIKQVYSIDTFHLKLFVFSTRATSANKLSAVLVLNGFACVVYCTVFHISNNFFFLSLFKNLSKNRKVKSQNTMNQKCLNDFPPQTRRNCNPYLKNRILKFDQSICSNKIGNETMTAKKIKVQCYGKQLSLVPLPFFF